MKLYAVKELCSGRILSTKSSGGAYYKRYGDAEIKVKCMTPGLYTVASFTLEEVPNDVVKEKGFVYCYKVDWKAKYLFNRSRAWNPAQYKTYKLIPD